ncbi:MAG: hypothetical protein GEEBNDBF_01710 [bacterium]|nr:hypothetical protein [bacterium]
MSQSMVPRPPSQGLGYCPQCGSTHIREGQETSGDNNLAATSCCLGACCAWPFLLIAPFLMKRNTYRYRECRGCGNRWQV